MKINKVDVEYRYDIEANAAYIYLSEIKPGGVADTYTCEDLPDNVKGDINLDFDDMGRLLGLEIIGLDILPEDIKKNNE